MLVASSTASRRTSEPLMTCQGISNPFSPPRVVALVHEGGIAALHGYLPTDSVEHPGSGSHRLRLRLTFQLLSEQTCNPKSQTYSLYGHSNVDSCGVVYELYQSAISGNRMQWDCSGFVHFVRLQFSCEYSKTTQ